MSTSPLPFDALRWKCRWEQFGFETTDDLADLPGVLGQQRAMAAMRFGVEMQRDGYNIYVLGPHGQGKRTLINRFLAEHAAAREVPDDWCYVHNFVDPLKPRALRFPAGRGREFRGAMESLVEDLKTALPAALESEEFRSRIQALQQEFEDEHDQAFAELAKDAEQRNIRLVRTPGGFAMAPVREGNILGPEEFGKLEESERAQIEQDVEELQQSLEALMKQVPEKRKETRDKIREVTREVTGYAIGHLLSLVKEQYADLPEVLEYLAEVEHDVTEHADRFHKPEESGPGPFAELPGGGHDLLKPYRVNLLVDNGQTTGAPVVFEDHPTYHNLIGRIEHQTQLGALVTDFSLIRGGALHRANGGYLILEVQQLLLQPYSWQGLARALKSQDIRLESLAQALSLVSTVGLEPEPIPLDVKVVLLGDRLLYYLLHQYDPGFAELFKVAADFNEEIDRGSESCEQYAQLVAAEVRRQELRPFDRSAIGRVLEHSARVAQDQQRLSVHMRTLADLLREADHWAGDQPVVQAAHVQQAIDQQVYRSERLREEMLRQIHDGTMFIDTQGEQVAQINGLSVLSLGTFAFGKPSRITATARLGKGEVVDIEREVDLGGSLHSKGVLILSSLLASRYAVDRPLSLSASLVFEQSYGRVDGDSASLAELCALLSCLADAPIRQALAVTGSVNQLGRVQPIGGVNEKIEGFFDVCVDRGLTGDQGVVIPAANARHLMLRADVVDACEAGRFAIYAVETVDEALELLTGLPAGDADPSGDFPAGSLNSRVRQRLLAFSRAAAKFAKMSETEAPQND